MRSSADRAVLVEQARDSIARGSRSFALASRLFGPETRERAWLLYAWCRACDDIVDGQEMGMGHRPVEDPAAGLAEIRTLTEAALAGRTTGMPAFDAFGLVATECRLPPRYAWDLIDGFALDVAGFTPDSEEDLLRYCYHVAGSVGVMMAIIMGVDADDSTTLDRACDLGLAFQLANIARDIGEDAASGRCYLPSAWLAETGIDRTELADKKNFAIVSSFGRRLAMLADGYERSARRGTPALALREAWAVLAAAGIYGDIARAVRRRGAAALERRVVTGSDEKLAWVMRAGAQALVRRLIYRPTPRAHLWTRPQLS